MQAAALGALAGCLATLAVVEAVSRWRLAGRVDASEGGKLEKVTEIVMSEELVSLRGGHDELATD